MKKQYWITPTGTIYNLFSDALQQPHVLIAGKTGSGKSVFIDGLITTALYRFPFNRSDGSQLILIDPKGTELVQYAQVPHTLQYTDGAGDAIGTLENALRIVENRFSENRHQGIRFYNGSDIYVIVDELAYLINRNKAKCTRLVQDIAALGRAAKVHLILATQTPKADVIPTKITCNFDCIVGLKTRNAQDSRNIIGKVDGFPGLQTLPDPKTARHGECYYISPSTEGLYIVPYVDDTEIKRIVNHWTAQTKRTRPRLFR